ncbi:MAG: efflux RND transporter periplasmic adaptor subunit [Zoogloeaceae bacterium]|jgi:RND family efflux transporter MFP subunit|nr:efflux RND transporter periplasmic adaptor subunit [Zoogloeaceae bacterium]
MRTRHHQRSKRRLLWIAPGILAGVWATWTNAADLLVSDCLIEPNQTVTLGSPVTGLLEEVRVKRADRVQKGQVLAQLESRTEKANAELARFKSVQTGPVSAAEGKIEFARKKFDRRKTMAQEKVMAAQERDDAEAELRLAQAELKVATENRQLAKLEHQQQTSLLNLRTIRSPFTGVVVEQSAYPGEVVEPGKAGILKLAQLDPLRVHVVLPKSAFGKIRAHMEVEVTSEIPANGRHVAKVRSVDQLVDAASGTFVVILELPNPKLQIPAGVTCKARFTELPGK